MYESNLKNLLSKHEIIYCVVTHLDKGAMETFGNKEELEYQGLIQTNFYDIDNVYSLNNSLEGQELPKLFRQGKVACIIFKPTNSVIVGMFYHEKRDFREYCNWSKELNEEVKLLWKE
ncbi:hypothetical protein [Oceanirhabdus sp. W0125-5]|uniref:hypothetical protein n=1 Tax=Oceanirhabdus sp. W0125-5 TaxID=2999116 RepID=UPI0022F2AB62|nr:hypothetical protein [Oceanirhabdus sp. W0125-5]WBW96114.1 hypothetical protein OW730_20825 [Oceanirhabdus sp. W0125-5]